MKFSKEGLHIELETKEFNLPAADVEKIEAGLSPLRQLVKAFPVSALYITIFRHRSTSFQVKTSLVLPGDTLVSSDVDAHYYPAFERCITNLVQSLAAYKERLGHAEEQAKLEKGTHQQLLPDRVPEPAAIENAIATGDYSEFRRATSEYEEPLRKRIGRWVTRYPEVDAQIGNTLQLADIVEAVFLDEFENYENRPQALRLGEWLENLIDPAIRRLQRKRDEELENIRAVQTLHATEL